MSYYDILEISENASFEVIHMAYKALAKKYHPDLFDGDPNFAEEKMKEINHAFSVLSNVESRAEYDAKLHKTKEKSKPQNEGDNSPPTNKKPHKSKKKIISIIIFLLFIISGLSSILLFITKPQNIEEVKDSVVLIETFDSNNDPISTGSGFCAYSPNWIITNFHVIEGANSIKILTDNNYNISITKVLFFNKEQDLAVILIDGELAPLKLGNTEEIKVTDEIKTIGSPKGELNTISEGIISSLDVKNEIRISAPISHGSSGGVLLNKKNEVIGITSSGYDDAQNLNFAISISVLNSLINNFENGNIESITESNYREYIGSFYNFDSSFDSEHACYCPSTLDLFNITTNTQSRFEQTLYNKDNNWYCVYNNLSENDQKLVVQLFQELNSYDSFRGSISKEINTWDTAEFFLNLDILTEYQLAIVMIDLNNYSNIDSQFKVVENYYLNAAEKSLIRYMIGDCEWYDIHPDNKRDIFEYFDEQHGTEDLGAILELLGYDVEYLNDGTLWAYW